MKELSENFCRLRVKRNRYCRTSQSWLAHVFSTLGLFPSGPSNFPVHEFPQLFPHLVSKGRQIGKGSGDGDLRFDGEVTGSCEDCRGGKGQWGRTHTWPSCLTLCLWMIALFPLRLSALTVHLMFKTWARFCHRHYSVFQSWTGSVRFCRKNTSSGPGKQMTALRHHRKPGLNQVGTITSANIGKGYNLHIFWLTR